MLKPKPKLSDYVAEMENRDPDLFEKLQNTAEQVSQDGDAGQSESEVKSESEVADNTAKIADENTSTAETAAAQKELDKLEPSAPTPAPTPAPAPAPTAVGGRRRTKRKQQKKGGKSAKKGGKKHRKSSGKKSRRSSSKRSRRYGRK